jgi:Dyp-type peroxidase family
MPQNNDPVLDLHEIQGDVLIGLQKNFEDFIFFEILNVHAFKAAMKQHVIGQITTTHEAHDRDQERKMRGKATAPWLGLNVSFTKDGLTKLLGPDRAKLDAPFENGADNEATWLALNDPPPSTWLSTFRSDTIDGVFLVTGPDETFVTNHSQVLLDRDHLADSIGVVYREMGNVRPDSKRGHEHFGFLDGVSQPGIRGLTQRSNPKLEPNQGFPAQDLIWPGEFVFGYPGQEPHDPLAQGAPPAGSEVPWARNGSLMVFRRLEQKVPEFNTFIRQQAEALGMDSELLAARMIGRWRSGAPLLLAPLQDNIPLGKDPALNNDFDYSSDPLQRACPYAAHIRKTNPRDDPNQNKAGVQTHRIIRAGIPFGPEVGPDEITATARDISRGLMFVCYQTSIQGQFEFIQSAYANEVRFVSSKTRPSGRGGVAVTPGFDPIIGQAPGEGPRWMDEPVSPVSKTPSKVDMPHPWVVLTAAAYFFVPSITALRTVLTAPLEGPQ